MPPLPPAPARVQHPAHFASPAHLREPPPRPPATHECLRAQLQGRHWPHQPRQRPFGPAAQGLAVAVGAAQQGPPLAPVLPRKHCPHGSAAKRANRAEGRKQVKSADQGKNS
eukprot:1159052-Pelagomonas_calceolata.AAC.4